MRRTAVDPLSVELHAGPQKPTKRPRGDLVPHLLSGQTIPGATRVTGEATDRFGRIYTEEPDLDAPS